MLFLSAHVSLYTVMFLEIPHNVMSEFIGSFATFLNIANLMKLVSTPGPPIVFDVLMDPSVCKSK